MTEMKWIVSYCFCSKSSLICLPRGTNFFLGSLVKCTLWMWYVLSTKKMKYNHASTDPFSEIFALFGTSVRPRKSFLTLKKTVDILLWKHIFVLICTVVFFMFWTLVLLQNWKLPLYNHPKHKLFITSGLKGLFMLLANLLMLLMSYGFEHTIVTRINKTCWTWFL